MRRLGDRKSRRKGFTLIEVLLVAGILALLAAFAIPRLISMGEDAKIDLARAAVGRKGPIGTALESYKWHMGKYPDTDEGLAALFRRKRDVDDERYKGPYLEGDMESIKDPWGKHYEYRYPSEIHGEETYDLWSRGPDGIDDGGKSGSDDLKNWTER